LSITKDLKETKKNMTHGTIIDGQSREALKSLLSLWPSVVLTSCFVLKNLLSCRGSNAPPVLSKHAGQPRRSDIRMPGIVHAKAKALVVLFVGAGLASLADDDVSSVLPARK
jgi:hypothetical protein